MTTHTRNKMTRFTTTLLLVIDDGLGYQPIYLAG